MKLSDDLLHTMLVEMARETRARDAIKVDKEQAQEQINYFAEEILGFKQQPIHRMIQRHLNRNKRAIIHAPTYFGKSTQVSVIRPLFELCRNQDAKIMIASASFERKLKHLFGMLKSLIMLNPKIKLLWPHMIPEERPGRYRMWTKTGIIVQRSDEWFDDTIKREGCDPSDPSIQIGPTGGEFQGARYNFGIMDDALPGITAISAAQREQDFHWIEQSFISRSAVDASIWGIGTTHHEDDSYHKLIHENGYKELKLDGEKYDKLWAERKTYVESRKPSVDGGLSHIAYMRQIRNKPISSAFQLFDDASLKSCFAAVPYGVVNQPEEARHWRWLVGIDLAGTKKTRKSTKTAFFPYALNPTTNRLRVVEIRAGTYSTVDKARHLLAFYRAAPEKIEFIVENNSAFDYFADIVRNSSFMQQPEIGATAEEGFMIASRLKTWTTGKEKHDETTGIQGMDTGFRTQRFEYADVPAIRQWHKHLMAYAADPRAHTKDDVMAGWFPWAWLGDHASVKIDPNDLMGVMAGLDGETYELDEMFRPIEQSELLAELSL